MGWRTLVAATVALSLTGCLNWRGPHHTAAGADDAHQDLELWGSILNRAHAALAP